MSLPKDNRDNEIAPAIYNGTSNFFDPNLSHNFPIIKVPTMAPTCSTIKNTKLEFSSYPARIIKFGSHVFKPKIINKQQKKADQNNIVLGPRFSLNKSIKGTLVLEISFSLITSFIEMLSSGLTFFKVFTNSCFLFLRFK